MRNKIILLKKFGQIGLITRFILTILGLLGATYLVKLNQENRSAVMAISSNDFEVIFDPVLQSIELGETQEIKIKIKYADNDKPSEYNPGVFDTEWVNESEKVVEMTVTGEDTIKIKGLKFDETKISVKVTRHLGQGYVPSSIEKNLDFILRVNSIDLEFDPSLNKIQVNESKDIYVKISENGNDYKLFSPDNSHKINWLFDKDSPKEYLKITPKNDGSVTIKGLKEGGRENVCAGVEVGYFSFIDYELACFKVKVESPNNTCNTFSLVGKYLSSNSGACGIDNYNYTTYYYCDNNLNIQTTLNDKRCKCIKNTYTCHGRDLKVCTEMNGERSFVLSRECGIDQTCNATTKTCDQKPSSVPVDSIIPGYPGGAFVGGSGSDGILKGNPTVGDIISKLLNYLYVIAGLILLVMLVMGGLGLMTAAGNPDKMKAGYGKITNAMIGFLIILVSYFVVQLVETVLGITIF